MGRGRVWWLGSLVIPMIASCGSGSPPAVPRLDGGPPPTDAGGILDGAMPPERGDAAVLPPADTEVSLPWGGPSAEVDLSVVADLDRLDVVFSIDTTGSFGGEINNLQEALTSYTIPTLRKRVADTAFGVSKFQDFPKTPYGELTDEPFRLLSAVTDSAAKTSSAVANLDMPLGTGGDVPEAGAEALYQLATGEGYPKKSGKIIAAYGGAGLGGAGFRNGALHIIVHATDAPSHRPKDYGDDFPNTHSLDNAIDAMEALHIRVIGIASEAAARKDLETLANRTNAVIPADDGECFTGVNGTARPPSGDGQCPLVFDVAPNGVGLSKTLVDGIISFLNAVVFDEVHAEGADNRLQFIESITAGDVTVPDGYPAPTTADTVPPFDGEPDTFQNVRQGVKIHFKVKLSNHTVRAMDADQAFRVTVRVVSDSLVLAEKVIRVRVPALEP